MPRYEYKLIPAPEKSTKHKGLKGADLFAATLEDLLNSLGAEGWQYLRAEILPEEVRSGLTSRTTTYRNLLVFRRDLPDAPATASATPIAILNAATLPEETPSLAKLFLNKTPVQPRPDPED